MIFPRTSESCEVIVIFLWNLKSVAGEDKRRFNFRRGHDAQPNDCILAKSKGLAFSVAKQRQTALFLDDVTRDEFYRLIETVSACRFGTGFLKLFDCVGLCFLFAAAAGIAALQFVICQNLDVVPPGLSIKVRSALSLC
jgi:hypothetical protein